MGNDEDPTGMATRLEIALSGALTLVMTSEKSPRGIPGFELTGGNITTWKVQGKLGGYTG